MMKYKALLNKFKTFGRYHLFLAISMNVSMITVVYMLIVLSVEKTPPDVLCRVDATQPFSKCSLADYCSKKYQTAIDYVNSINNWQLRHNLICDREIYIDYLVSLVFFSSFVSSMTLSVIGDKMGRLFTFRFEAVGAMIALIMIYQDSLSLIFIGVGLCQLFAHLHGLSLIYLCEFFHEKPYIIIMVIQNILFGSVGIILNLYATSFKETRYPLIIVMGLGVVMLAWGLIWQRESPDLLISIFKNTKNEKIREQCRKQLRKDFEYVCSFNYNAETTKEMMVTFDKEDAEIAELMLNKDGKDVTYSDGNHSNENFAENVNHKKIESTSRNDSKYFIPHFFLAIYLWVVNQFVFYGLLTNLPTFEKKIPYASVLFFIGHIIGNTCIAVFSNAIHLHASATYYSVLSGSSLLIIYLGDLISPNGIISSMFFLLFMIFKTCVGEVVYLLVPTLFEPVVRSRATAYSKIPAKLLLVVSPFIIGNNLNRLYFVFGLITWLIPAIMFLLY